MICFSLKTYNRQCGGVTGGVSRIWAYDPSDFDWTQEEENGPYTTVLQRDGATTAGGAKMFEINFQSKEAERKWKQSRKGCSVKYEHEINAQLPQLSQDLTNFLQSFDAGGCCCGLGLVIEHNDGKIFVAGEKYVNGGTIPKFEVTMDGSDGTSGKLFDDMNGANVVIKGDYKRELFEFTGGAAAIEAFK